MRGRSDAPREVVGRSDPTPSRFDVRIRCDAEVATWPYPPLRCHFPLMSARGAGRAPSACARLDVGWSRQPCRWVCNATSWGSSQTWVAPLPAPPPPYPCTPAGSASPPAKPLRAAGYGSIEHSVYCASSVCLLQKNKKIGKTTK